jgi:glycosyltransferase involved in cell wall biosynthesis
MRELQQGVYAFQPAAVCGRLNHVPLLCDLQAAALGRQIHRAANQIGLRDPLFFYTWWQRGMLPLCAQMKRDHFMVHLWSDHPPHGDPNYYRFVELSDKTLTIPRSDFHRLKAKFGGKVALIPQAVEFTRLAGAMAGPEPAVFTRIPRPRIGYLGHPKTALNLPLLLSVLKARPDWHFVSVGAEKAAVPLANAHTLPWARPEDLGRYVQSLDVGFLPYDCERELTLHGVPLKMFEYFAFGLPVVSTPLIHIWEYKDLIYFGDTAEELVLAVQAALNEPPDSPKRAARVAIARNHSIENVAAVLRRCLPLDDVAPVHADAVTAVQR